jgi:hypothetical protein
MKFLDKLTELQEADEAQQIEDLNNQSVDLQIKAIDTQIALLNKKKQELLNQKKGQ